MSESLVQVVHVDGSLTYVRCDTVAEVDAAIAKHRGQPGVKSLAVFEAARTIQPDTYDTDTDASNGIVIRDRRLNRITSSAAAMAFCRQHFARLAAESVREEFHIVTLNTKNEVIGTHQISVGTLDQTIVHPREVFRPAILDAAKSVILVHNHPSGDAEPSREDYALTTRMGEAGRSLGLQVLDHIVVAKHGTVSVQESQL